VDEYAVITAPFGRLGIQVRHDTLIAVQFLTESIPLLAPAHGGLAAEVMRQIDSYLVDPEFTFSLPLAEEGTAFQRRVWAQIARIPSGHTLSYRDIAQRLGSAPRAVGGACGRNPLPLIVPCHRVVACSGVGGFNQSTGKQTVGIKEWLLAHEQGR
jgi:methylated-DNA-[protein]-cysteine S-methyltransferase